MLKIKDPREDTFEKWWEQDGKIPLGDMDIVDRERCLNGYVAGINFMQKTIKKYIEESLKIEHSRKPFIERRGIADAVNEIKFREGFLAGMKDSIESL